jgi:N-methylhydantoinase B/oxoprolinase/acetone carboxylase alpha subunit
LTELRLNGERLGPDEIGSGQVTLRRPGDWFEVAVPGGAGYGNPDDRDPRLREEDVEAGLKTEA